MKETIKEIELLYFEGCPSWKTALHYLNEILCEQNIDLEIQLTHVSTNEEAERCKFPGSPTIRVNQKDLFPTEQSNYALGCRVYQTAEGFKGSPTKEMMLAKLAVILSAQNN